MRSLLISCLFILSYSALAQSGIRLSSLSIKDGLNQNTIGAIIEDQQGLMWFGTQDGLCRYDGSEFEVLRRKRDGSGLTDNFVINMVEDDQGIIWIGTRHGLNRLDPHTGRIHQLHVSSDQDGDFHQSVQDLVKTKGGILSFHFGQLYFLSSSDTAYTASSLLGYEGYNRLETYRGQTLLSNGDSLYLFDEGRISPFHAQFSLSDIINLSEAGNYLFAWNEDLLSIYDGEDWRYEPAENIDIQDAGLLGDEFIFGTNKGLYTLSDNGLTPAVLYNKDHASIQNDYVGGFFQSQDGSVWMGTNRYGAFRWDPNCAQILHIPGEILDDPIVWSVELIDNQLLVCSTVGINVFELEADFFSPTIQPESRMKMVQRLEGFHPTCLFVDESRLWVGTRSEGLKCFTQIDGQWIEDLDMFRDVPGISMIDQLDDGRLVMSSTNGVFIREADGTIQTILPADLSPEAQGSNYCMSLHVDGNQLWLPGIMGLYQLQLDEASLRVFVEGEGNDELPFHVVTNSFLSGTRDLWISTMGGGIAIDQNGGSIQFEVVGGEEGLKNEVVYDMVETHGSFIACTNEGLSIINTDGTEGDFQVSNLVLEQGIPFLEHSQNAGGMVNDIPWFGGVDGCYFLLPDFQKEKRNDHTALITSVQLNYQPLNSEQLGQVQGGLLYPEAIQLYPQDENITLSIAQPGIGVQDCEICYRLDQHEQWICTGKQSTQLNFNSLPHGESNLEIGTRWAAAESVGQIRQVSLVVHPPFWETTWFLVVLIIAGVFVIIMVVRNIAQRRLREEILKREAIERVHRERERISMELHDNIGAQITHVITSLDNMSYKISAGKSTEPEADLDDLSDFARGTMQTLRDTIWTINQDFVEIEDFSIRFQDYMGRILAHRERPLFESKTDIIHEHILDPSEAIHMFRVLQEAANNAIKHAHAEHFQFNVNTEADAIRMHFSDDGVGFSGKEREGHYGMKNMMTRMKEIGGKLEFITQESKGTRIELLLPR